MEMTMGESLLPVGTSYVEVYARFRWHIPATFNIGVDACDRHADDPSRLAMIYEDEAGHVSTHTFAEFRARSNQLAHVLTGLGDAAGQPVPVGDIGEVAIRRPDPVLFLGYWQNPQATAEKFVGDWALTGDLARKDDEGYFWFVGRKDDLISSGGYRIGPGEIEDCLAGHSAVAVAAAVGSPDPVRGEVVKAFGQLREGVLATPALGRELAAYVRTRLSAHE